MRVLLIGEASTRPTRAALLKSAQSKGIDAYDITPSDDYMDPYNLACLVVDKLHTEGGDAALMVSTVGNSLSMWANKHVGIRAACLYNVDAAIEAALVERANIGEVSARAPIDDVLRAADAYLTSLAEVSESN